MRKREQRQELTCRKTVRFSDTEIAVIERIQKEQGFRTFSEAVVYLTEYYAGREEKWDRAVTKLWQAGNGADISSQIMLEVLNSICYELQIRDCRSTEQMEHPVVTEARQLVKERIARYKQQKDWKGKKDGADTSGDRDEV